MQKPNLKTVQEFEPKIYTECITSMTKDMNYQKVKDYLIKKFPDQSNIFNKIYNGSSLMRICCEHKISISDFVNALKETNTSTNLIQKLQCVI
jgi:hypothetical protein